MPVWFMILLAICIPFGIRTMVQGPRNDGMNIPGELSRLIIMFATAMIVITLGMFAATQLGLLPGHAP